MNIIRYLKNLTFLFLINLILSVNVLYAEGFDQIDFGKIDVDSLRTDVAEVEKFLAQLPAAEREAIEAEALKILEEMPEEQFQQFIDLSKQVAQPPEVLPTPTPIQKELPPSIFNTGDTKKEADKIDNMRKRVSEIITHINLVEEKTSSLHRISKDPNQENRWADIKKSLDELNSLLEHIINPVSSNKDSLITILIKEEFAILRNNLERLDTILKQNEPQIKVPDTMGLKHVDEEELGIDPTTKKRSIQAINNLINQLTNLSVADSIKDINEMIKKYAPQEVKKNAPRAAAPIGTIATAETAPKAPAYDDFNYASDDFSTNSYVQSFGTSQARKNNTAAREQKTTNALATQTNLVNNKVSAIKNSLAEIKSIAAQEPRLGAIAQKTQPIDAQLNFAIDQMHIHGKQAIKQIKQLKIDLAKLTEPQTERYKQELQQTLSDAGISKLYQQLKNNPEMTKISQTLNGIMVALENI